MSDDTLKHYGTPRHSGRYPWGSGKDPHQSGGDFLTEVEKLRREGKSPTQIADHFKITTTQLRAHTAIAKNAKKAADIAQATKLRDTGMSPSAIGREMGRNESSIRAMLSEGNKGRVDKYVTSANYLKGKVDETHYLDVGAGVDLRMGISKEHMKTALTMLETEGYVVHKYSELQPGTGKKTTMRVLCPPGTPYPEVLNHRERLQGVNGYTDDFGHSFQDIKPMVGLSSKRILVRYAEEGGDQKDGLIELRLGVPDISLGHDKYAQVRIQVDDSHYMKGMAIHSDNIPDGYDVVYNVKKSTTGNKLDAMKPLKTDDETGELDAEMPFGSIVRQTHYTDAKGQTHQSVLNILGTKDGSGAEGSWDEWSRNLSSQFLSKQKPELAKKQLDIAFQKRQHDFDEIMALTNPAVRQNLLADFADNCDSAAVELKAARMPRQRTQVLIPVPQMADNEVYAPNFRNGERVALVRHPHGGTFEIPDLVVNNNNPAAKKLLGQADDAIGINHRVAQRLSGADFDGDTAIVIPNSSGSIITAKTRNGGTISPALKSLETFDPISAYPGYEGMKPLSGKDKQKKMGEVSNLINDMTIKGASDSEVVKAVKHSMVIIDAEKHKLNHKLSYEENGIAALKAKYQLNPETGTGGAATLISRASSEERVLDRKDRPAALGGRIDPITGHKMYVETGESYTKYKVSSKTGLTEKLVRSMTPEERQPLLDSGQVREEVVQKRIKSTRMAEAKDAHDLITGTGTPMERIYAEHANKLKALANQSRIEMLNTPNLKQNPSAKAAYKKEVASLNAKLAMAQMNAPLERQAITLANLWIKAKKESNPNMSPDQLKKIRNVALVQARSRVGAKKNPVDITPAEWHAIQAGAVSHNVLSNILRNSNPEQVKKYATPKTAYSISPSAMARAKAMLANGHTQAQIADALGVPPSTLSESLRRKG